MTSDAGNGLMTPGQVAKRLEVSPRTLWRMAKQDGFPQPIRYNRKLVRWRACDVQRYIDSLAASPGRADNIGPSVGLEPPQQLS